MTDKEKLERYEKMNTGIRPKYHKGNHIKDWWTCGQCGETVSCGVISNFCMSCGYRIKWDHPRCLTGANEDKNVEVTLHEEDDLEGQMDITDFPEVMP